MNALQLAATAPLATASPGLEDQLIAATTGGLLLSAVLLLWRRSVSGSVLLLALQGASLGALALLVAWTEGEPALILTAGIVLAVKAVVIPLLLRRAATRLGAHDETAPLVNPATGMLLAALLTTVAYLVSRPIRALGPLGATQAVPVGIAVVLIGFLVLVTRRQALAQVVGFVMVDNGIGATALLTSGGLPVIVDLGALVDVVAVVVILVVLSGRLGTALHTTELHDLDELRD